MKMIESVIEKCRMLRYNNCKEVQIRCRSAGGTSSSPFFYTRLCKYRRVLFFCAGTHNKARLIAQAGIIYCFDCRNWSAVIPTFSLNCRMKWDSLR